MRGRRAALFDLFGTLVHLDASALQEIVVDGVLDGRVESRRGRLVIDIQLVA